MKRFRKYARFYSYWRLRRKVRRIIRRVGDLVLRQILTLVVLFRSKDVPLHAKAAIIAVLGYLICPLDVIPDPLPIGLLDDLAAISLLLAEMSIYRTEEMEKEVERVMKDFKV